MVSSLGQNASFNFNRSNLLCQGRDIPQEAEPVPVPRTAEPVPRGVVEDDAFPQHVLHVLHILRLRSWHWPWRWSKARSRILSWLVWYCQLIFAKLFL